MVIGTMWIYDLRLQIQILFPVFAQYKSPKSSITRVILTEHRAIHDPYMVPDES